MSVRSTLALSFMLGGSLGLSACSGVNTAVLQDIVDIANGASRSEVGNAVPGELRVENDSEVSVCRLLLTDFENPDAESVDLIAEHTGQPLPPGEARVFPQGEHPLMDNHNLMVTAEGCDGERFDSYSFTFVEHGGAYSVRYQVPTS